MNPDRAALIAGAPPPATSNKKPTASWSQKPPGEKMIKPLSRSQKKQTGQKKKRAWTKEKPTSKRSQRAGPRSLAKQGLRVRLPKTPQQKAKQRERKEFRVKQKAGAAMRKIIKTARREGYRVIKRTARPMKEYQARYRLALISVEQEVTKKVHIELDEWERRNAMAFCNSLGFTIENTEGTKDIKPRVLGLKGKELDIDNLEKELHAAEEKLKAEKADIEKYGDHRGHRVDLSKVQDESKATLLIGSGEADHSGVDNDFISFDMNDYDEPVAEDDLNYNHKMRRKLNRAILAALIKKENLVRSRTLAHCKEKGIEIPKGFTAAHKSSKLDNHRMLVDGSMETAKQERIRKRVETAKYNELARAFRKTAKAAQKAAAEKAQQEILEEQKADRLAKGLPIDGLEKNPPWAEHFSEKSRRVQREKRKQQAQAGKKSSDSSGSSDDDDSSDSDASVPPKSNDSKKRPRSDSDVNASGESKKMKLSEKNVVPVSTKSSGSDQSVDVSNSSKSKAQKKKLKKSVQIADPPAVIMIDTPNASREKDEAEVEEVQEKMEKKGRKEKKVKKANKEKPTENSEKEQETAIANDWNADALDGDAARKDKFLRLLGGKKESTSFKPTSQPTKATTDISKVQNDLEKQFQQGIELKHGGGGQGKRRGIGA